MKKKRFLTLVLCLALAALALGAFAACNDGGEEQPPEPTAVVTLDSSALTVDLYDGAQLSAETENTEEAVVWATSDASVVTVENGYVFGVREGTATVTASAGGASAACTVTVASSGAVPALAGVPEALTVLVGSPVKVQPRALYKGTAAKTRRPQLLRTARSPASPRARWKSPSARSITIISSNSPYR